MTRRMDRDARLKSHSNVRQVPPLVDVTSKLQAARTSWTEVLDVVQAAMNQAMAVSIESSDDEKVDPVIVKTRAKEAEIKACSNHHQGQVKRVQSNTTTLDC